ncbi:MAG TPA: M28 family peptidase [Longimicrobium sp.]|nr:M28 family peptidase [Longimicrobium sp.]
MPARSGARAVLALALALSACTRGDPALGRHVDHPEFPAEVAWAFLTDQVAAGPRIPGKKPHERTLVWLRGQLGFRADTVLVVPFDVDTAAGARPVRMTNVLARFRPAERRRILLVAHWDSRPRADESASPEARERLPVPGANDNASGVAVLVTLAEVMRQQAPGVGVDLLFTDGDDLLDGRMAGTERYLSTLPADARPAFAIVLEQVGDRDAWFPRDAGSRRHAPAVAHRVWETARAIGRDSLFVAEAVDDSAGAHLRFNAAGIPTVLIRDPVYGPGNSWWHTVNDLPGNVSAETLAEVGEVLAEIIYRGIPEGGR